METGIAFTLPNRALIFMWESSDGIHVRMCDSYHAYKISQLYKAGLEKARTHFAGNNTPPY